MLRIRDFSITRKLTWMNMLVSGAALLLACAAFIICDMILYRQSMVRNALILAQVIADNSVSAVVFNDPQAARNTLAALHNAPHVTGGWIYNAAGRPFAGYARDGRHAPPPLPAIPQAGSDLYGFKDGHLELIRPIFFNGKPAAFVYIQTDLGGLYERLGMYAEISVGVLLASLLAAYFVSWFSRRVIARPIQSLSETARVVSLDKNFAVRAAPAGGRDEISELIGTFNSMLGQIQEREAEREELLANERAARTEAERASLLKDEFLATLSHELRTPLNAIVGWTHLLRAHGYQDPELSHGLSVIERNTRAQSQLVEDMLDMSRIISGKTRLNIQPVDLLDVVTAAMGSVQHSAEAKGIRLETLLDATAGPVRGDPGRLQQCVWNLLSNAIKYTPKEGSIQVTVQHANGSAEICVIDNGEGIPPEFLPHVFERFRQADGSTTRRHGGLGLGLSIVKHLVELHGGRVRAESAGESKGAKFSIELPLRAVERTALAAESDAGNGSARTLAGDHPSLKGISVLVVDDDPDARELIKHVLESCGARVVLAASSAEGFNLLLTERPTIILSDIGMPGEDGYEFIRKVRALAPDDGGRTPAAALTAFARSEDRTRALRAGYQTHAAKPVRPAELTAVVASLAARE